MDQGRWMPVLMEENTRTVLEPQESLQTQAAAVSFLSWNLG